MATTLQYGCRWHDRQGCMRRCAMWVACGILAAHAVLLVLSLWLWLFWRSPSGQHTLLLTRGCLYHVNRIWIGEGSQPPRASWADPNAIAQASGLRIECRRSSLDFWGKDCPLSGKSKVTSQSYPLGPALLVLGIVVGVFWRRGKRR